MRQLLDAGVNVGLGVDGTASNDCGSLIEEARQALFLQRSGGKVEGTCAADAEDTDQLLACSCQQGLKFSSGKPWAGGACSWLVWRCLRGVANLKDTMNMASCLCRLIKTVPSSVQLP